MAHDRIALTMVDCEMYLSRIRRRSLGDGDESLALKWAADETGFKDRAHNGLRLI